MSNEMKIHLSVNGRAACNLRTWFRVTDPKQVTCRRCLKAMAKEPT